MIDDPVVVVAATPRAWAASLRAHAADHGGVRIRATVLRAEDALAEHSAVVLVDDVTSFLTASFVTALQEQGRAVLGLYDPTDAQGKGELIDTGVDVLVPADVETTDLVTQIAALAARQPQDRPSRPPVATRAAGRRGRVVGVAGPTGGVGVSELAVELAAALASADVATALLDLDELAPSLAQRLGIAVHPNLHTALQAAARGREVVGCMQPLATRRPLRVLPGMVSGEDWQSVVPGTDAALLTSIGVAHGAVVLDLGHCLPAVEGPTGVRYGQALAFAARADDLLLVAAPTPTAVSRTIELYARLAGHGTRLHLVLNQVGNDRFVRDEVVAELRQATGAPGVHLLAHDPAVQRAAWQGGRVGRGRFRTDVATLVRTLGLAT